MKKVRYVSQWTKKTGSDHEALFVRVQIRQRGGKWADLLILSINMGGHFSQEDMKRLLTFDPDVVACQEAGDQGWVVSFMKKRAFNLVGKPSQVGQRSTPTFVGERVHIRKAKWVKILGAVRIGQGAGPDDSKPKWWDRNRLAVEGTPFGASSIHLTASQQFHLRFLAALKEISTVVHAVLRIRIPMFVIGDYNSSFGQKLSNWLLGHGMTDNHKELGEIATHENRSIDKVLVQRRLVA